MAGKIAADVIILTPKVDMASQTIKRQLLSNYKFKEKTYSGITAYFYDSICVVDIDVDSIYAENVEDKFEANLFIFATRHSAASGIPALLTHAPGNWTDEAKFGGKPRSVCIAPASSLKIALTELVRAAEEHGLEEWKVGLEVTHHGPYVESTPTMFIELGSSEKYWRNEIAARAVAQAIMKVAESRVKGEPKFKIGVGFGGPHYAPIFTKLVKNSDIAIGHIIP
ncbi:MAG: D-tyrosyl-tRNA(Tyr) deacylase, partial [Candidatus Methanomethylicota archaeon]